MADVWYYQRGDRRTGPVSSDELKRLAQAGELQPTDLLWKDGMDQPVLARQAKGLFPEATEQAAALTSPAVAQIVAVKPDSSDNSAKASNSSASGPKLAPKQLREATVTYVLRERSSLSDISAIRDFLTIHDDLAAQSQKARERLQEITTAISVHSPLEQALNEKRKDHATAEVALGKLAQSLGRAAFHALLAGKIGQLPIFAERLALHRKIADLEAEKLSLTPPDNAGFVEKTRTKAQQVVILGKIKLAAMSEGSMETAIGKDLLHNNQEEIVRCDQTSSILESIGKQRSRIVNCRAQMDEAQAALESKRAELCQSLGLHKIESAKTLDDELRKCQSAINQKERERRDLENTLPDRLLTEQNSPQEGRLAEMLIELRQAGTMQRPQVATNRTAKPTPTGSQSHKKPTWIAGWIVVGFVLLLVTCSLRDCGNSGARRQFASGSSHAAVSLEEVIKDAFLKVYNEDKQQLFEKIHPAGIAKNVVVHDVTIIAWKHGQATNRPDDIRQYAVRWTIYWDSPAIKNGVTKISQTFDTEVQRCVSYRIEYTDGITNDNIADALVTVGGTLLREMLKNSMGQ